MRPRLLAAVAYLLLSCGGSFSPVTGAPSDAGEAASSADGSSSGAGDATAEGSGSGGDGAASETGTPDGSSSGGDATSLDGSMLEGGPACADISGGYGKITTTGLGCGDFNPLATECIGLAQEICAFQLTSPATALPPAVNGLVILQADGSFANAALQLGTKQRTGCLGQWAPGTQTLTIDCGGTGTGQSCGISMVRQGPTCK